MILIGFTLSEHTTGMALRDEDDSQDGIARHLKRTAKICFVGASGGNTTCVILIGHDGGSA